MHKNVTTHFLKIDMTESDKAVMQQALDALIPLSNAHFHSEREMLTDEDVDAAGIAVVALQAAIAQPVQAANRTWSWDKAQDTYAMDPPKVSEQPSLLQKDTT